tara:strand:- start:1495 stop:1635 length:141 start_codon:yes stop_codon:yes gene_type:complete
MAVKAPFFILAVGEEHTKFLVFFRRQVKRGHLGVVGNALISTVDVL